MTKIFTTNADCVVLDCEDGVALNRKQEARTNIRNLFDTDARVQNDLDGKYSVRINPALTKLAEEDINTIFTVDEKRGLIYFQNAFLCLKQTRQMKLNGYMKSFIPRLEIILALAASILFSIWKALLV